MKKTVLLFLIILQKAFVSAQTVDPLFLDGKVWVKFKEKPKDIKVMSFQRREVSMEKLRFYKPLEKKFKIRRATAPFMGIKRKSPLEQTYMLSFDDAAKIDELIEQLQKDDLIEYVEKVPLVKTTMEPNDPSYSQQWHLNKIGAAAAWNQFSTGGTAVIAIVDDALDRTHPDLAPNLWINPGEIPGNGIDDDNNGFIDDVNGWDFASSDNDPNPPTTAFRHGTHVAGIASAATNNAIGVAGIGFSCKLMAIKTSSTQNLISHGYHGIIYAADNGADIINCSWGGTNASITAKNIINYALASGCIVVAAAGNNGTSVPFYPASYPGVVSVASSNEDDLKSGFSSYGSTITVTAPGSSIYSTFPNGAYGYLSGTSMASPLVAGVLGLMRSLHPGMPNADLINCLKSSAVAIDALNPDYAGQLGTGRIDAAAAMACVSAALEAPPVAEFSVNKASITAGGSVVFIDASTYAPTTWTWQFPGGTPSSYNGKNPPPVMYSDPGVYTVTLSVSNNHGSDQEVKENYVTVGPAQSCVTINWPVPSGWSLLNYLVDSEGKGGWVNGLNEFLDKEKAMYYDASSYNSTYLTEVLVAFGKAYSATPTKQVPIRIYDGTSGSPGAQLATTSLTMEQIMKDVDSSQYSRVSFVNPVLLPTSKKLFVSVDLTNLEWGSVKDTLSIVSNQNGQTNPSVIWEKNAYNEWHRYTTLESWDLSASLFIHPFLTTTPSVATFTASSTSVCAGEVVELDAAGSTYDKGIQWIIPGGAPSMSLEVAPSILFNEPGNYRIELATEGGGCALVRRDYVDITVNSVPELSATISKNPICAGESAAITVAGATTFSWFPSAGLNSSSGPEVIATPSATTTYTVTGSLGSCSADLPVPVEVRSTTTSVGLAASANEIAVGTEVTFTATPVNGGTNPVFDFRRNGSSVQNSGVPYWSSSALANGDVITCWITSSEACVVIPQVSSQSIVMEVEAALPVTLVSFSSQRVENSNLLKWEVSDEVNSAYYEVQASLDAGTFIPQGKVDAGGTSPSYTYLDRSPLAQITYYRLKMVDKDGSSAFSKIIAQSSKPIQEAIKVAPNPIVNSAYARLLLNGTAGLVVHIQVYNQLGQQVHQVKTQLSTGKTEVLIPVSSLNGVYQVTCSNESSQVIGRTTMVVLH